MQPDTIVVCRPEQLREASIVLSCVAGDRTTPLIVLEPAPATQAQYRSLYGAYRSIADARDLAHGTELARRELRDGKLSQPPDIGVVDAHAEQLTPYREWVKHQRFVARLLARLAPSRAIFLFLPEHDDTHFLEPLPMHRLSDEQHAIVPDGIDRLFFLAHDAAAAASDAGGVHRYASLGELADTAWAILQGRTLMPGDVLQIPDSDVATYIGGLYRALEMNAALRPAGNGASLRASDDAPAGAVPSVACDPSSGEPREAVLIESENDAERLLGVLYARRRHARLIVCPVPDGAVIETARAAVERRKAQPIVATGQSDAERIAAVKAALFTDDASASLLALERAVSSGLPDDVISAVGDLPLTVLTSSTPYHFVAKNGVTWAEKPIGHITGDASLLLLAELFPEPPSDSAGVNLLFDPGYFSTTETRDVLSELHERISYSLLLDGNAGSSIALTHLAPLLPIELLFFNTHGSDNGIKLADLQLPLPAYKVVQRTTLGSRPIVFNNSCSSWVGVGREFVRAGALGYIGTLWKVRDVAAAAYAKDVVGNMVHANVPVSVAMRGTAAAGPDVRAYIFVGTASMTLGAKAPNAASSARMPELSTAQCLLGALAAWLDQVGGTAPNAFVTALEGVFLKEIETLLDRVDATLPPSDAARIETALLQMRVYAALVVGDDARTPRAHEFFLRWCTNLAALPDARARSSYKARLYHFASRIPACRGQWDEAVGAMTASIAAAREAGDSAAQQNLELCDALTSSGQYPAAREALESAARVMVNDPAYNGGEILGRRVRLALAFGEFRDALSYARDGFARAEAGDQLTAQASFKMDAARAYLGSSDYAGALVTAREAVAAARLAYDDSLELGAYELLVAALLHAGELPEATDKAQRGLAWARQLGDLDTAAAFARDLGDIAEGAHEPLAALRSWRVAAATFARLGRPRSEAQLLERAKRVALALGTSDARTEYLALALEIIDDLPAPERTDVCSLFVAGLQEMVGKQSYAELRPEFARLRTDAERIATARGEAACEELKFMRYMATTFDDYANDRRPAAQ